MPGSPSITTFANQNPPWSLAQLDANFTAIAALLKDVGNYSPYVVDTGAANAYAVTFSASLTYSLAAGAAVPFKAANANTGASTLNANATGAKAIKNIDGSDLWPGQIPANGIVWVMYDGTNYQLLSHSAASRGVQKLTSGSVTNAATLDIVMTAYTAFRGVKIVLSGFRPANDGDALFLRVSTDGGGSYDAGGANYGYVMRLWANNGALAIPNDGGGGAGSMQVSPGTGNAATASMDSEVTILNPTSTAFFGKVRVGSVAYNATSGLVQFGYGGGIRLAAQDTNAVRFLYATGNIAEGNWAIFGIP